jgi:hypothetical protein
MCYKKSKRTPSEKYSRKKEKGIKRIKKKWSKNFPRVSFHNTNIL